MARRRKSSYNPNQYSLFDIMATHIEQIKEENLEDDLQTNGQQEHPQATRAVQESVIEPVAEPEKFEPPIDIAAEPNSSPEPEMPAANQFMQCRMAQGCTPEILLFFRPLTGTKTHLKCYMFRTGMSF